MTIPRLLPFLPALLAWILPVLCAAQSTTDAPLQLVVEEENLRAAPGGGVVATVLRGARLTGIGEQAPWREVVLEGWLPSEATERAGGGDTVATREAATLRAAPDGQALARTRAGMRLRAAERRDGWVRVRRRAWIWGESVAPAPPAPAANPAAATPPEPVPPASAASPALAPGHEVRWTARFIALQRAERLRTDFTPGEPYILAREAGGHPGFVYIAVPPEQLAAVRRLVPLQRFRFVARVRTAKSELMGQPVLELISLGP